MKNTHLKNNALNVVFNTSSGLPVEYRMGKDVFFPGATANDHMMARICQLMPRSYRNVPVRLIRFEQGMSELCFQFAVFLEDRVAANFQIRYLLHGKALTVTLEEVEECEGHELIEVVVPTLVSLKDHAGTEWMAHTMTTGHVMRIRDAVPGSAPNDNYFGNTMAILPVVMFGHSGGACVMEVTSWMDGTLFRVEEWRGDKSACMGTVKKWRVDGSAPCQTNDDDLRVAYGNDSTPNMLVLQKSSCRIDFTGDYDANGIIDWVDCAKLVHKRMPRLKTDYYDNRWLYIMGLDSPEMERPTLTFEAAAAHVRKVAALIDYFPQTIYLGGWQFDGHDTGYPAVSQIGNRIGGYEGYLHLKSEASKVNANISLDDNYDDAYLNSPEYDPFYIAKLPDGTMWRSRTWTRDTSAIIGLAKYMKGPGRERVHQTTKRYHLKDSILVDVLSWFGIRNDWDSEHPASGVRNFLEGRYQVVEEFSKDGVDVISEQLRYPWIGRMSLCVNGPVGGKCPFGGEPAPILALIYRNVMLYGGENTEDWGRQLFFNGYSVQWFPWHGGKDATIACTRNFYLSAVPGFKLRRLEMVGYRRDGDDGIITLEGNAKIVVNLTSWSYHAFWDGNEISCTGSVFCPMDDKRIAFYSVEEKTLQYPVPSGWDETMIRAKALFEGHSDAWPIEVSAGMIHVNVKRQRPVIVFID